MDNHRRIELPRASRLIADRLREQILYGELSDEQRVLSEPDLADQLGISRHHLREALRLLEQDGLVKVLRGRDGGIFLTAPEPDILSRTFEGILARNHVALGDLFTACKLIGAACAELAAKVATDDELDEFSRMVAMLPPDGQMEAEIASRLRIAMARASHNQTLLMMMLSIEPLLRHLNVTFDPHAYTGLGHAYRTLSDALRARDAAACASITRLHTQRFEDRLRASGFDPDRQTVAEAVLFRPTP